MELTSGSLRKEYEGKSQQSDSSSPYTGMSSDCSSREIFWLLPQTVHPRLTDFSLTEGVYMVLYQLEAGAAVVVLVVFCVWCHPGYFYSILESCKMIGETSVALHFHGITESQNFQSWK